MFAHGVLRRVLWTGAFLLLSGAAALADNKPFVLISKDQNERAQPGVPACYLQRNV